MSNQAPTKIPAKVTCPACDGFRYASDGVSKCLHCDEDGLVSQAYREELKTRGFRD